MSVLESFSYYHTSNPDTISLCLNNLPMRDARHCTFTSKSKFQTFNKFDVNFTCLLQWRQVPITSLSQLCVDYMALMPSTYVTFMSTLPSCCKNTALLFTNATQAWSTINTFKTWSLLLVGCINFLSIPVYKYDRALQANGAGFFSMATAIASLSLFWTQHLATCASIQHAPLLLPICKHGLHG